MLEIVEAKFVQNPDLAKLLVATGNIALIEVNHWHDNFWGQCNCETCVKTGDYAFNNLGIILMRVRHVLSSLQ
jgi:predicted NAD-dependent protein-ADP-ribosyltransferase YbiA (DUF1768 family)